MTNKFGSLVLPGDEIFVKLADSAKTTRIILGPGLRKSGDRVFACKPGILKRKSGNLIWVDSIQKRYIPCKGETVIGAVTQRAGDIFRVDVGSSELSALPYLSFEGATKKNRPDVNVGDLVFAKFLVANKDFESELICIDSTGKKQKLGVLRDGFVFNYGVSSARKLRSNSLSLMKIISKHIQVPSEIVIGMNGKVWIRTKQERDMIAIGNAILALRFKNNRQFEAQCIHVGAIFNQNFR